MSRRILRQGVGAVAVSALLLLAAPAQAWAPAEEGSPSWRLAWSAVMELWIAAQEVLGLRAAVAADTASAPPGEQEQTEEPRPGSGEPGKGDQGGALDPDGLR